jgi:hypothetical protein
MLLLLVAGNWEITDILEFSDGINEWSHLGGI